MVRANTSGLIKEYTKVNGEITKWMDLAQLSGQMEEFTPDFIKWIKNKARESIFGLMEKNL